MILPLRSNRPDAGVNVMNMSSAEECKKFMWNHYKDFQQSIVWEIVNIIFNYTQWMQCAPTKLVNNLFILPLSHVLKRRFFVENCARIADYTEPRI